jgi:hypothetical protein
MANNFRITGNKYLSKAGNNTNDGTTPELAKLTLAGALAVHVNAQATILSIGSGTYKEPVAWDKAGFIKSDGLVVFSGDGANIFELNVTSNFYLDWAGGRTVVKNYTIALIGDNLSLNGNHIDLTNFHFKVPVKTTQAGGFSGLICIMTNCIYNDDYEVYFLSGGSLSVVFNECLFFGSLKRFGASGSGEVIKSCHFSPASQIYIQEQSVANIVKANFRNNNVQGTLSIMGNVYAIQDQLTLTPQNNGYAVGVEWLTEANLALDGMAAPDAAGWDVAVATCINRDPLFNSITDEIFSVAFNSPLLGGGVGGVNIGGVEASSYFKIGTGFTVQSSTNITEALNVATITSGTEGSLILNPVSIAGGYAATLESFNYIGGLAFDTSATGGTVDNTNVPDSQNYAAAAAGRNPNRLSIQARWIGVDRFIAPTVYDNGGIVAADSWVDFELSEAPKIDGFGFGNGSEVYSTASGQKFEASWVQFKIILRDDYAS